MTGWTVYVSWRAYRSLPAMETAEPRPDWPAAHRLAKGMCCLAGVRYLSVQDPNDLVAAEYDRYTGRWRQYPRLLGVCGDETEPDGEVCTGELWIRSGELQTRCTGCGGWYGAYARPEWWAISPDRSPDHVPTA